MGEKKESGFLGDEVEDTGLQESIADYKVDRLLELLDLYMDMVEKQDEVIYRMSRILIRQETDLQLLKNDCAYSESDEFEMDKAIAKEVLSQYEQMKSVD